VELILKILHFIAASFSQLLSACAAAVLWFFIFKFIQEPQGISEILTQPQGLMVVLALPVFTVAFTAYAIGGQSLLRKVVPKLAEKEPKD
jgi:hypothetical protein